MARARERRCASCGFPLIDLDSSGLRVTATLLPLFVPSSTRYFANKVDHSVSPHPTSYHDPGQREGGVVATPRL